MKLFLALFLFFFLNPQSVHAHAFGETYRMPIPLNLYLFGGAGALIFSFFLIGYFVSRSPAKQDRAPRDEIPLRGTARDTEFLSRKDITKNPLMRIVTNPVFVRIARILSVFLLGLCIITGFFGSQIVTYNFNMTFFWVIFVVGFTYLVGILGNIWATMNPWKVIVEWVEGITDLDIDGFITYPKSFSYYPAFFGYFIFICLEIVFDKSPFSLATFLLLYTNYSFFMAILFGKKAWEEYIDFFSVFFRLIGTLAPIGYDTGKVYLRIPFTGAIGKTAPHFSLVLIILFMLSSTAADGFMGTAQWFYLFYDVLRPVVLLIGINAYQIIQSLVIFLSPFLFLAIYLLVLWAIQLLTRTKQSLSSLMLQFAYSLLPIAFVYHFAHYFVMLVIQGQEIIPLLSDPFGFGWNLFGTSDFLTNPSILAVNFVWHSQVAAILIGHIAGVFVSHIDSIRLFPKRKDALISQIPLLILMVFYTVVGLWILAQPITGQ